MIATNLEGFVEVAEAHAPHPADEPLRRSFEATLTRLDRLLGVRARLVERGPR